MIHLNKTARRILFSCMVLVVASGVFCNHILAATGSGSISGTVLDDQGQPIENLIVQVWSNMCWNNFLGDGTTDANGNYLVENLPVQDVYVVVCTDCTNINYIYEWWDDAEGTTGCGRAEAVAVEQDLETSDIDFTLVTGPRRVEWTEINVRQGVLGGGFDILLGFEHLITSATLTGPEGFSYEFDLQNDVFAWFNECNYLVAWWKDFNETFAYGEYTYTFGFQDGVQISESYDLQQVDVTPVDINSMSHTVNPDGRMDFSWTSPVPGQRYQVNIYQNGERVYRSGLELDMESVGVSADQLRCVVPGVDVVWEVRAYDDNSPSNTLKRSGYKLIDYTPQDLVNRSYWFQAVKNLGNSDWLGLYFNIRPGSRDQLTSAVVTGPEGFTPYTFDLVNDRFDMTTESRLQMNGWAKDRSAAIEPIVEGEYILTAEFDDGYVETDTYTLSADDLTPVDADTMGYEIFENGAIRFYWSLPQGVSGQRYSVGIRSKDGSREYARSAAQNAFDTTSQYFSIWNLRALPQGEQFIWFVRAYGGDDMDTQVQTWSSQMLTYNPFDISARGGSTFVLTATSPDLAVTAGSDVVVYGTAGPNEITLAGGAKAELVNFGGENMVVIQSSSNLFTVSRSGLTVTFEGTDGTLLKILATTSEQTIVFDQEVIVLKIQGNQVMLNDEAI